MIKECLGKVINAPYNHIKTCMNTLNNISVIKKKLDSIIKKKKGSSNLKINLPP